MCFPEAQRQIEALWDVMTLLRQCCSFFLLLLYSAPEKGAPAVLIELLVWSLCEPDWEFSIWIIISFLLFSDWRGCAKLFTAQLHYWGIACHWTGCKWEEASLGRSLQGEEGDDTLNQNSCETLCNANYSWSQLVNLPGLSLWSLGKDKLFQSDGEQKSLSPLIIEGPQTVKCLMLQIPPKQAVKPSFQHLKQFSSCCLHIKETTFILVPRVCQNSRTMFLSVKLLWDLISQQTGIWILTSPTSPDSPHLQGFFIFRYYTVLKIGVYLHPYLTEITF